MSLSDLPLILLLLMPGFIALVLFNAVSHKRHLTDLEMLLWMLAISLGLLAVCVTIWHKVDASFPSVATIVKSPTEVDMRIVPLLYALATVVGYLAGHVDRFRLLEAPLLLVGIDLRRSHDVWFLALRDAAYFVIVHLKGGRIIYGFPQMWTTNRQGDASELYLDLPLVWDDTAQDWLEPAEVHGVWIDASSIDHIEFTLPVENAHKEEPERILERATV